MAERSHAKQTHTTERAAPSSVSNPVGTLDANDLSLNLNRQQWVTIATALGIAAGESAIRRDFEQMFDYSTCCNFIGARLGLVNTQTAGAGDIPPPGLARTAGAS